MFAVSSGTIGCLAVLGNVVAMALVCGAIPAHHDRVCERRRVTRAGRLSGRILRDLPRPPQIYHEHKRPCFEVRGWSANFLSERI